MHKSIHNHADTAVGKSKPFDWLRTLRAVNGKRYSTSTIRNLQSKICNLLAHFMHINEFYVVPFKDLELSHSGGRICWKHILGLLQDVTPSPARERCADR